MTQTDLTELRGRYDRGENPGLTSVCSAHPLVIEAALVHAADRGQSALIEATCNQVNQDGGYTGMTPASFRDFVFGIAGRVGFARERIILGGDHLGPNPWKSLPPEAAMQKAELMIAAYAGAGFTKLHLDASMGCAGEAAHLPDEIVAERAVRLARAAEAAAPGKACYVIGTEIPTPGGATEALDHVVPTTPDAVKKTYAVHEAAFRAALPDMWPRVIGIVVQPGVEFGHDDVAIYAPEPARDLVATLAKLPGLVFEAHSTDYQPGASLSRLRKDGFCILKVGPELTFALREALYGLDAIRMFRTPGAESLPDTMEAVMLRSPADWRSHYHGTPAEQRVLRHFSYSDRIRYYWPAPEARKAVDALLSDSGGATIPETMLSQYLPRFLERVKSGVLKAEPREILIQSVRDVLERYETR
ncbi:D-tagatose-bisphosphate aldolase, class II, non-catalytic subunit [Swaminathania salitolerans]|uniref:D-tagatose-bisphosphate aldolase, class II, non-catalytic subunit n=1 Tax=Swaminathania salitolerans TaxID=182838 RepID=A0A511BSW0_9PROT|nr:D-tagatose-bisphosphate aldolase, class II, non-catalytic subunit [Swaminathania salitolerans]GBQ13200.1 putative tagatose 6-phosphate kinase [Swaminathania salitolerans LMG 21291]GEL03365.1 D-tagatose-bisphosphate aldolase, class II, non-catalytic subunit [Swaminathania salitolerans]